ncbi:MAG TPA: RNA polymerase factor sigma-54, partial [Achromobacter sp.]
MGCPSAAAVQETRLVYPTQELRLRQQMTLAPRLQQSVKLLQMTALEFTTAVEQALASNPFLEDADEQEAEQSPAMAVFPPAADAGDPAAPDPAP